MSYLDASLRDYFRKKRNLEINPMQALKAHARSSDSRPVTPQAGEPANSMVTDPMLEWGKALEQFHEFQVSSGAEILRSGQGIQTAADEQNVSVAREELQRNGIGNDAMVPGPQPMATNAYDQGPLYFKEPWNNPFSTVPGGMGCGPIKPPGWFPPGM